MPAANLATGRDFGIRRAAPSPGLLALGRPRVAGAGAPISALKRLAWRCSCLQPTRPQCSCCRCRTQRVLAFALARLAQGCRPPATALSMSTPVSAGAGRGRVPHICTPCAWAHSLGFSVDQTSRSRSATSALDTAAGSAGVRNQQHSPLRRTAGFLLSANSTGYECSGQDGPGGVRYVQNGM